jgi:hypothetical protein
MGVATAEPKLQDMLDLLSIQVDTLLESLAGTNLLEARRRITRDLHFEPRAEELQTFVAVAGDESSAGARYELPRRFLALRMLVDRQARHILETKMLDAETMNVSAEMLDGLIREVRNLESDLEQVISTDEALDQNDRDYLLKIGDAMSCSQDDLVAHSVLAHRLVELAIFIDAGNLEQMESSLSATEREQLEAFAAENITQESCRSTLDSIAVRSLVQRQLREWGELGSPSDDDNSRRIERDATLGRIRQAMIALESVSTRLQTQRDAALVAGIESLAAELREAGRGLFSVKLRMAPILRDPYVDAALEDESAGDPADLREQLRASAAAEAEAEGGPRSETEEEIYLGALKDMHSRKEAQKDKSRKNRKQSSLQLQRRRMKWMIAASVVLAFTSAIVNFVLLPGGGEAPSVPDVSELPAAIQAKTIKTAGPMMMTHVEGWHDLDENTRRTQVDRLGEIVSENGMSMLIVVDEYGQGAAVWDQRGGTSLVKNPSP